ncbi:bifunctional hydroxymethylpyrimidine kinase/phosphomethylpyrimidine kinase [Sediminivirga luteola]|uniref:Bifunctional hydroxymethylpyrimidine kinase/phosphomethylpyrimidine kinase n=1 Tax=Sediminivirga luteola TaxID=1774748 RepID=A0A8J2XKJ8_9MICO|nr:bifunctional hydroxymethylpyrimidine kinase/phosphomethylpyrimidine kinase [Sediminivirga luteola]GGA10467.1 bifunctional hydroxymethylpyrimidine kinase/phosphomethylpyrimidine kinase [Sediminivirga luteola]
MTRPPVALTIAGTDPSGGAGIQADLKAFTARRAYGTSVLTALVAQNTHGVERIYPLETGFVADQLESVLSDLPVDAAKTGMLFNAGIVELVAAQSARLGFLVVDPVMVSTSGHPLLEEDAVAAMRERLLPVADLVTPNLPEAALLLGEDEPAAADPAAMRAQARRLLDRGPAAVLLKGGHLDSGELVDVLAVRDESAGGVRIEEFPGRRVDTPHTHGTGCTLSAAIVAEIARSRQEGEAIDADGIVRAVRAALGYLSRALRSGAAWQLSLRPEGSHGPVDHLVDLTTTPGAASADAAAVQEAADAAVQEAADAAVREAADEPRGPELAGPTSRWAAGEHSQAAWDAGADYRRQTDELPFLRELAGGTLDRLSFVNYIVQDEHYLLGYARAMSLLAARTGSTEEARFWAGNAAEAIAEEQRMHANLLADSAFAAAMQQLEDRGLTAPSPTTEGYTSWLVSQAAVAEYEVAVAAVLPCFWIYAQLGKDLKARLGETGLEGHPYREWIAAYGAPEFDEAVRQAVGIFERSAASAPAPVRERMIAAFTQACRYERDFFDHAHRLRTWE